VREEDARVDLSPKPVMTLRTMRTTATPSMTPRIETSVITEATERFGFKYFKARKSGKFKTLPRRTAKHPTVSTSQLLNISTSQLPQMSTSMSISSAFFFLSESSSASPDVMALAAFVWVVGR